MEVKINPIHSAVFAPTGVGKGVNFVIPRLLEEPESMVIIDFKGENAKKTAEFRKRFGQVVLLDPYRLVTKEPDTLNPLEFIDPEEPTAIDSIRDIAEALVIRSGREAEPHWMDVAELWIGAMTAAVVFGRLGSVSLQSVRELLTDPDKMARAIELLCNADDCDGMLSRLGNQLTHFVDKERASTLTTANRFMRFLDTPVIAESTRASSFDPSGFRSGMTVYLIVPPDHAKGQSPLLRLWIASLMRAVVRGGIRE
jgi:type IV secretion system protein VirD4